MLKRTIAITVGCAVLALFAGCSGPAGNNPFREETLLDKNWGRSFETAKYNQTLDPEAGKNLAPVEGLDGKAAGFAYYSSCWRWPDRCGGIGDTGRNEEVYPAQGLP